MINLDGVTHHPALDEIVDVLCRKTQNTDKSFFRTEVAYFFGKMAASMRATISTKDRGEIPVNIYALALGSSGHGKGHSVNIMENNFLMNFKKRFIGETFPMIAEKHLWDLANDRAAMTGTDPQDEFDKFNGAFKRAGTYPFTFDSGTAPAVKQLRNKLLLANIGAINYQVDEIGSNLEQSTEILNLYLELYDQGLVKQKLTKNTSENIRDEELDGKTPTNMLLFGTPAKLLDGSKTEDSFYSLLETGYARRCLFGYGQQDRKASHTLTAEQIYLDLISHQNITTVDKWSNHFYTLSDPVMYNWIIRLEDDEAIRLIEYKKTCEQYADSLPEHKEIQKAEISHRYFKALKLAGAYSFIDGEAIISMDNLLRAILLVEESGKSFQTILNREKSYVKLAKFIASEGSELTHADLHEALPFYKSSVGARNEMMTMAIAWGYKQHIVIKKSYVDSVELYKGETLKETNIDDMIFSYSDHYAYNYGHDADPVSFDKLYILTQAKGMHWSNHRFKNGHRSEENTIAGFNLIVVDVDGGTPIPLVQEMFKEYKHLIYLTKSHTEEDHCFRLILPINYILELDTDDYKEFMQSFAEWLPFRYDTAADQRSRKWLSNNEGYIYNSEGHLLDALQFIPRTSKNESFREELKKVESLDNFERWFASKMSEGNRNNNMLKFALGLVDSGLSYTEVKNRVVAFNKKLINKLPNEEIENTVLRTVSKRYHT